MKFRKKPVVIEASHFDGTFTKMKYIMDVFPELKTLSRAYNKDGDGVSQWKIETLKGGREVKKGDWIIKGVLGDFYPCKPDIFEQTYEPA
jgi:hypothetical protein